MNKIASSQLMVILKIVFGNLILLLMILFLMAVDISSNKRGILIKQVLIYILISLLILILGYIVTKRATIYFDPELHKALKLKALETSRSITDLVNQSVREALSEDAEDINAFEERKDESLMSYDQMLKKLKKNGTI